MTIHLGIDGALWNIIWGLMVHSGISLIVFTQTLKPSSNGMDSSQRNLTFTRA